MGTYWLTADWWAKLAKFKSYRGNIRGRLVNDNLAKGSDISATLHGFVARRSSLTHLFPFLDGVTEWIVEGQRVEDRCTDNGRDFDVVNYN